MLGLLTITTLLFWRLSLAAGSGVDPAANARRADADWAAAAAGANAGLDSWISFYAVDALVLLPDGRPASGAPSIRAAVGSLLARPHFSVTWRPESQVDDSGELSLLIDAYELRFDDTNGVPITLRGRRLEIWRKQADAGWKCIVDTWNLDPSGVTLPAPVPPAPAPPAPAPPASAPATLDAPAAAPPPAQAREPESQYGDEPVDYEATIRKYFLAHLTDPQSVQYRDISKPEPGYTTAISGLLLMREKRSYGWKVQATVNAKDPHAGYVGFKTYTFLFRGEKIVDVRLPLPGDEMK